MEFIRFLKSLKNGIQSSVVQITPGLTPLSPLTTILPLRTWRTLLTEKSRTVQIDSNSQMDAYENIVKTYRASFVRLYCPSPRFNVRGRRRAGIDVRVLYYQQKPEKMLNFVAIWKDKKINTTVRMYSAVSYSTYQARTTPVVDHDSLQ